MKQHTFYLLLVILSFLLPLAIAWGEEPFSLKECYTLARAQSEKLQIGTAEIAIAEAQYRQALSAIYPQLMFGVEQRFRDNEDFGRVTRAGSSVDDAADSSGGARESLGKTQLEGVARLTQPLFTGFRDMYISRGMKKTEQALNQEHTRQRELLFLDVAELFFQYILFDSDLKVFEKTEELLRERIKALAEFVALGKSRESEVLAAQSELADLNSTKERTTGALASTQELLAFLTGRASAELSPKRESVAGVHLGLEESLARARQRADLKASELRVEAQQHFVTSAERQRWPRLELEGNAYPFEDPDRNRDWDVLLRFELPIFEGGRIEAKTEEQLAKLRIAELSRKERERIAEREVRVAFSELSAARAEIAALRKLLNTSKRNFTSQSKDYELGVVTNLEVLQSIRQVNEAQRRLIGAQVRSELNYHRLQVASGGMDL